MLNDAMEFALDTIETPPGKWLWIYANPGGRVGERYLPTISATPGQAKNISRLEDIEEVYDAVAVSLPKQRQEAMGLLALALSKSRGLVVAEAANDAGGKRLADDMQRYGVPFQQLSKYRKRIVWSTAAAQADKEIIAEQLAQLHAREVEMEGERWWSVPGLFAWDRIDPASRLLLEHLPTDLAGTAADFGCGYGYLSANLARRYPDLVSIDAYDNDRRAVECCTRNAQDRVRAHWQDIAALEAKQNYNLVIMNPPFHTGKSQNIGLGQLFIAKAWESLKPGGRLYCVANRNLPYEKTVPGLEIAYAGQGYKIITGRKP